MASTFIIVHNFHNDTVQEFWTKSTFFFLLSLGMVEKLKRKIAENRTLSFKDVNQINQITVRSHIKSRQGSLVSLKDVLHCGCFLLVV